MLITDPVFWLFAAIAVLLTGISKGGFGSALGGISVPLMALAISPVQAAAIMLPVLCVIDVVGFRVYYKKWDLANLRIMIPGLLIGIVFGTFTFNVFDEHKIRVLIGVIAVVFTLHRWWSTWRAKVETPAAPRSLVKGTFWSTIAGFTSFVAHAGGPPVMVYMLPQKMDKIAYVATVNFFFLISNAVKLVPYAWLGQFSKTNLMTSLLLVPLAPIGVWLGLWLQKHINHLWFYRIASWCLFLTGLQLIYEGLTK